MSKALEASLSALPGEAEVWGWAKPDHEEVVPPIAWRGSELPAWATSVFTIPLVTLASLQAMQARAEKAERERDYWQKQHDERTFFLGQCATEKEAAEARVKDLEDAWKGWKPTWAPDDQQVVYEDETGRVWHPHRGYWAYKTATALARAEARLSAVEQALKPFAQIAEDETMMDADSKDEDEWFRWDGSVLTVGDFRCARTALKGGSNG